MMLMVRSCHFTAVFLARMVIPFSRCKSPDSMTRSVSSSWSVKEPVWRNMASTKVVFPWSTWAIIAIFLREERSGMALLRYLPTLKAQSLRGHGESRASLHDGGAYQIPSAGTKIGHGAVNAEHHSRFGPQANESRRGDAFEVGERIDGHIGAQAGTRTLPAG